MKIKVTHENQDDFPFTVEDIPLTLNLNWVESCLYFVDFKRFKFAICASYVQQVCPTLLYAVVHLYSIFYYVFTKLLLSSLEV